MTAREVGIFYPECASSTRALAASKSVPAGASRPLFPPEVRQHAVVDPSLEA